MSVLYLTDGYKVDHRPQYPKNTELIVSNWTARSSRIEGVNKVVFFGLQYFMEKYLIEEFTKFFETPKDIAVNQYKLVIDDYLGKGVVNYDHIADLHDLGYLPLTIYAAEEGELVPIRTPMLFIYNTKPEFFWLTNYVETMLSATLWLPCTSATTAFRFKQLLTKKAIETGANQDFINWQGHDFSFRGMGSIESAILSGMAHLTSFTGTDTIPAIQAIKKYYKFGFNEGIVGGSVPATEHSVMCMGEQDNEIETFRRLIKDVYPKGIVSIVSDTWDYWKVITEYIPTLKEEILSRDGKVVIRPDSGDPVEIVCGNKYLSIMHEAKGSIEMLWEIFGGKINSKGYKELNPHIGLIYGDGINYDRCRDILERLEAKGFASSNIVFGIGSYTYQYVTRDTFGFAVKATYGQVNGVPKAIFKNPKTDSGEKKSAKGLIRIIRKDGVITGHEEDIDGANYAKNGCGYKMVFFNGKMTERTDISIIRDLINQQLLQD